MSAEDDRRAALDSKVTNAFKQLEEMLDRLVAVQLDYQKANGRDRRREFLASAALGIMDSEMNPMEMALLTMLAVDRLVVEKQRRRAGR